MPTGFNSANQAALDAAEGVYHLTVPISSFAEGDTIDFVPQGGKRKRLPGDTTGMPQIDEMLDGATLIACGVTKSPPPDFLKINAHRLPLIVTHRVIDALHAAGIGGFSVYPVEIEHDSPTPPKRKWPEYAALVPIAGPLYGALTNRSTPFEITPIQPPPHEPGVNDIFAPLSPHGRSPSDALPERCWLSYRVCCFLPVVELGLREKWKGVSFYQANMPRGSGGKDWEVRQLRGGKVVLRPPMPTELSIEAWLQYAIDHTHDFPGRIRRPVLLALAHYGGALIDAAMARIEHETDPEARYTLEVLLKYAP